MMCDDIDASLCVEGRCIIIVSDCLPCVHTRNSDNNTQWSPSLFLSGTNPIRSLPWHWSPLLSLSKHQIQLSLNTSPTVVPHHCMGLLHATYFITKKKMWKNLYFFWERLGMERLVYGMGECPPPPLFDIFYENWMVRSYAIDWSKIDIVSSQNFLITLWSHCESAKFKPTSCSLQVFLRFLKDSLI